MSNEANQPSVIDRRTCKVCGERYSRQSDLSWRGAWRKHENESKNHAKEMKTGNGPFLLCVKCPGPECRRMIVAPWHPHQFDQETKTWHLICKCKHELQPIPNSKLQRMRERIPWEKLKEEYPDEFARQFGPE